MMYCNKNLQCHDSRQKNNIMVQIGLHKNEMSQTGFEQRNFKLSSSITSSRTFLKKNMQIVVLWHNSCLINNEIQNQ